MTNETDRKDIPVDEQNARKAKGHMETIIPEQGPQFVLDETVVDYRGELLGDRVNDLTDEERKKYTIIQTDEDKGDKPARNINNVSSDEVTAAKYFDIDPLRGDKVEAKEDTSKPAKK